MSSKISLVLEGGGMRGAYTAGCLSWLLDQNIRFDSIYGISTGAVNLCAFLMKSKKYLYDFFTQYINDKRAVGIRPLLREGVLVSYDYLFDTVMVNAGFTMDPLKDCPENAKIGIYDLSEGKTSFHRVQDLDLELLKAATTLPILGRPVKRDGHEYLDGGITKMIAIEESMADGNDKHLIIATKPLDYVRKPAKKIVRCLMKHTYSQCPQIEKDYAVRHLNYHRQVDFVKELAEQGKAMYLCPSRKTNVTRISGSTEELIDLYNLAREDMEAGKEELFRFLEIQ